MKTARTLIIVLFALAATLALTKVGKAAPLGTAFTYQGRLLDDNVAADGVYDFQFKLYEDPNAAIKGSVINVPDMDVIDGYFTVELDFGSAVFDGDARWLEIGVRPGEMNDPNGYTPLSPLQAITPAPYALYAKNTGPDADWTLSGSDMYSSVTGNVGIGTATPAEQLHVSGNLRVSEGHIILRTEGFDPYIELTSDDASDSTTMRVKSLDSVGFAVTDVADDPKFVVNTSGNVGIGTTNPLSKLSVGGDGVINTGVYGIGGNYGVYGSGNYGVLGIGASCGMYGSGLLYGVYGLSISNDGVYGSSDTGHGVYGKNDGNFGYLGGNMEAVYGFNSSGNVGYLGGSNYGVYGYNNGSSGNNGYIGGSSYGVYGESGGNYGYLGGSDHGVYGKSALGYAVYGENGSNYGYLGGNNEGVYGYSVSGDGVYGKSVSSYGVHGEQSNSGNFGYLGWGSYGAYGKHFNKGNFGYLGGSSRGVQGTNNNGNYGYLASGTYGAYGKHFDSGNYGVLGGSGVGVRGSSDDGIGVHGMSTTGSGMRATSNSGYAIEAIAVTGTAVHAVSNYWAGWFEGDVYVTGEVNANSYIDRTPYPKDLATAYNAVMSMERLGDGQYMENNKELQLDHSALSDFIRGEDGHRDLSATVSCLNEVVKDLIVKQRGLVKTNEQIDLLKEQLDAMQKENQELKTHLALIESMLANPMSELKGDF